MPANGVDQGQAFAMDRRAHPASLQDMAKIGGQSVGDIDAGGGESSELLPQHQAGLWPFECGKQP